eukprot:scaffold29240_cov55-Phaeocystis_antarctica.AAC.2
MYMMFRVRSTPVLPRSAVEPPLHTRRHRPSLLARTLNPHRMPSFRHSAGRVGVQPAAELRHL